MLQELVKLNRSYRRFYEDEKISVETLKQLIELARLSASGANRQPLKYLLVNEAKQNAAIFPHLRWAGYLSDWSGPSAGERPAAYIVIVGDSEITTTFGVDHGIAAQSILLGAVEKGYGGCMIASIDKKGLRDALQLAERYELLLVLALGKPKEQIKIDIVEDDGDIRYRRDADQVHHVPKRSLDDLILER